MVKHTLLTRNRPGTWRNTLCRSEIDPGRGGTPSADRKSTQDVAEQILPTRNRPGTWRSTLYRLEIAPGRGGTSSADRKLSRDILYRPKIDSGRGGTLFRLLFLQIYLNKRAQKRKSLGVYFLRTIIPRKYAYNFRCWALLL